MARRNTKKPGVKGYMADLGMHQWPSLPKDMKKKNTPPTGYTMEDLDEGENWSASPHNPEPPEEMVDRMFSVLSNIQDDPSIEPIREAVRMEADTLKGLADEVRGWDTAGSGGGLRTLSKSSRERLQNQAYHLYYRDGVARNIINIYTYLTIGNGMSVIFPEDTEGKQAAERWDEIARRNNWPKQYRRIIRMSYCTGEWFTVRYPLLGAERGVMDEETGEVDREKLSSILVKKDPKEIKLRSLEPEEISHLRYAPEDREQVVSFCTSDSLKKSAAQALNAGNRKVKKQFPDEFFASDVTHFVPDTTALYERGRTILEPVMKDLSHRRLFMLDRMALEAIRTRIPLVMQVPGGPKERSSKRTMLSSRGLPRPGTVWVTSDKNNIIYPQLNLGAGDASKDYRLILLAICAGVSLPEFLLTADASNANMASTLTASSPLEALIGEKREQFAHGFEDLIEECVGVRPKVDFQRVIVGDPEKNVNTVMQLRAEGLISKATAAAMVGVQWSGADGERARIEEERENEDIERRTLIDDSDYDDGLGDEEE